AAVHCDPRRLVDHEQVLVLKDDRPFDQLLKASGGPARLLRAVDAHRRQAHFVAGGDPILCIHPFAVDAHLALAQQTVDAAARYRFEVTHQEVVDSLARLFGGDGAQDEGTFAPLQRPMRRPGSWKNIGDFGFHAEHLTLSRASKVLITLTMATCCDNIAKPCQALNPFFDKDSGCWALALG